MKKQGFTLIELLVVVAIIGLLASIVTVSLVSARAKGRDAKRVSDIKTIQLALETYYSDNGAYPNTVDTLVPTYLPTKPTDPNSTASSPVNYPYTAYDLSSVSGSTGLCNIYPRVKYHLGAAMESDDTTNSALVQDNDFIAGATYTACNNTGVPDFNGKAAACSGTTAALHDPCYDVTN